ncbi:MAG: cbb3-type cytochrome c oxidase subunit II [Bacteriovoracales bacterium]|nr:cbb3-type cytochrome c oxidase subunit II [Bacteriovoracales bacterium]
MKGLKSLERFSTLFLVAGLICFLIAFGLLGVWPALMTDKLDNSAGEIKEVPRDFKIYYQSVDEYKKALFLGKQIYIKEACWHCHSQYIRPVGNESPRYGLVSTAGEYQNELNKPHLFGTRRVGPDLIREAGKRTNDWHFAHLYNPKSTEPMSVMPSYTWYFDKSTNPPKPTPEGVALVAYLQSLGAWAADVKRTQFDTNQITMPPEPDF